MGYKLGGAVIAPFDSPQLMQRFCKWKGRYMERARNSIRNIIFGLGGQMLNILMSFAMRVVFTHTLGSVYLGVNGLFTNILMVFSLADLGVGTAIIYAMYKPIAEGNREKIQGLMKMYAKAYIIIGFVIVGLGLVTMPFIQYLVKTDQNIPDLKLIYMLFVLNTASTYFFAYKGTLITAHQKNYIVTNVVYSTSILCYGAQIVVMLLTHNYILTLSIQVGTNMLQNIITMIIANRMYPYIRGKNDSVLPRREKRRIYRNIGSLMFYRTGQVIINGTDNIIISSMVGIVESGVYSNYLLVTTTIKNLLLQVFHAITASVGNLTAVESDDYKYQVYNTIYFGNFWMFGFATACFYSLFTPFIQLCFGKNMLLGESVVILVVLNFYLTGMRNVNITFRDTMGVFREGRFVPMISAAINLVVSIWLAPKYGLEGVFIGTLVSMVTSLMWMEPVILFKYGFKRSVAPYFGRYALYLGATVLATGVTRLATGLISTVSIPWFLVQLLMCLVIPNAIFYVLFGRTKDFKMLTSRVFGVIKNRLGKKKKKGAHAA